MPNEITEERIDELEGEIAWLLRVNREYKLMGMKFADELAQFESFVREVCGG
jgi:hypothetical protein